MNWEHRQKREKRQRPRNRLPKRPLVEKRSNVLQCTNRSFSICHHINTMLHHDHFAACFARRSDDPLCWRSLQGTLELSIEHWCRIAWVFKSSDFPNWFNKTNWKRSEVQAQSRESVGLNFCFNEISQASLCTLISYDYDRVCQNKQSLRKYVELSTRFNDLMIFNERFLERARVSVQIPTVLRWARAFCLGGVGSPCRGKLWQTLLSLRTTCATTRDFLPIASFRKKKHKKALHLFLILHVLWPLSNLMFMQCMAFDPSDVHCCPGDEVLQRHGSKAEGPKTLYLGILWCESQTSSISFYTIFMHINIPSNDAVELFQKYSPARSFGAKLAWIQKGGFELLGLFLDVLWGSLLRGGLWQPAWSHRKHPGGLRQWV